MKQMILLKNFLNLFLNNYQKGEILLRNGSNFIFQSVDLLSYTYHKISLKRGKLYLNLPNG